jgi:hypothetical protein
VFTELQLFQPLEPDVDKHIVLPVKQLHSHITMIEYPHNMILTVTLLPTSVGYATKLTDLYFITIPTYHKRILLASDIFPIRTK